MIEINQPLKQMITRQHPVMIVKNLTPKKLIEDVKLDKLTDKG